MKEGRRTTMQERQRDQEARQRAINIHENTIMQADQRLSQVEGALEEYDRFLKYLPQMNEGYFGAQGFTASILMDTEEKRGIFKTIVEERRAKAQKLYDDLKTQRDDARAAIEELRAPASTTST